MVSRFSLVAILALAIPAFAHAQPPDARLMRAAADGSAYRDGSIQATPIAARAVRRGVIVRGPRGRARTFVYRGRTIDVIRRRAFVYPPGLAYRRWRVGELLPVALIAAPFFFLEYEELGLRPPPPGYRWVRYGPAVVLVNEHTREIEDIAPDAIDENDD